MTKIIFSLIFFCINVVYGSTNSDLFNLDLIYNKNYQYSLPRPVLESYLSGKAFDNNELYSKDEADALKKDITALYQKILHSNPTKEKVVVVTAGGPGAGKTLLQRAHLERKKKNGFNFAYICPDDVCLKNQYKTYLKEIKEGPKTFEVRKKAYDKWRPGSNGACHLILAHLIREKYGLYFGTTSTAPQTALFFDFLKKQGYQIHILHISAPDDVRWKSIQERDKTFVQTTEKDVREKGLLFPQRIADTYLKYADRIEFYYRDQVNGDAKLSAIWIREEPSKSYGRLHIYSVLGYAKIKELHDKACEAIKRPDLYWKETVEKS